MSEYKSFTGWSVEPHTRSGEFTVERKRRGSKEIINENEAIHADFDSGTKWHIYDAKEICRHHWLSEISDPSTIYRKFSKLKREWLEESIVISNVEKKSTIWSYQQIIGMGPTVVPVILEDMIKHDGDWFWALRAITNENPVTDEIRGEYIKMKEAWLAWGRNKGLID